MKFYIAARFNEKYKTRQIYKHLQSKGHKITADWTLHKSIKPYNQNSALAKDYAIEDMKGVAECDVFVLISSQSTGAGSAGELGAAILSQIKYHKPKIYVIGKYIGNNFFYFHPAVIKKNNITEVLKDLEVHSK
jgi:hypothetical protein